MKGYIFTMEAFLSLLVVILLLSSLPLLFSRPSPDSGFDSFVILTDSFEVLEKGYHDSFANWIESGTAYTDSQLSSYFEFIQNETGKRIFVSYKNRVFPDYGCMPGLSMKRLVVTKEGTHTVTISLCT